MNPQPTPANVFRKLIFLAALGFAVVLVSGPVLAILSVFLSLALVILSFAFVGFLVWLPFHFLFAGKEAALENLRGMAHTFGDALLRLGKMAGQVLRFVPRAGGKIGDIALGVLGFVLRTVFGTIGFVGETAIVALCGAIVGAAFGLFNGNIHHNLEVAVPMSAALGAAIATVVSTTMTVWEKWSVAVQPAPSIR